MIDGDYKTRLAVQRILRNCIMDGMSFYGISGWGVMEFANASFQSADSIILMNMVRSSRVGWQSEKYSMKDIGDGSSGESGGVALCRTDEFIEQQDWQIHTVKKRTADMNEHDILAEDMSGILVTWFNGRGCDYFRKFGCANLRIDSDSIIVYNDDSGLYQKRCVFTVKVQVPKELTARQDVVELLIPDVMPI